MSQTGLVRKLFNEKELLDLFNNDVDIFKSKPTKNSKSVYLESDEEDEKDEDEEGGGETTAQEAFEELDLDSMSDSEKISLAHEILSKCKDIDCSDIMSSLEKLAEGEDESDEDDEDEEDEED